MPLTCSHCSVSFLSKKDRKLSGRIVKDKKGKALVLCPVCSGCYCRFFPSEVLFEKLDESEAPYSCVTVYSPKTFSELSVINNAYLIASLAGSLEDYSSVKNTSTGERLTIDEYSKKVSGLKADYITFTSTLVKSVFSDGHDKISPSNTRAHLIVGEMISTGKREFDNILPEHFQKIGVFPSIDHISSLISNNVFTLKGMLGALKLELVE
ncbi:hypothetical protein [Marinomonas sp. 2405UD68-3]|uniref:hypothetical protein n=1 Tax=Marinomonas sp. 2405UD68-3 TaxID=3391835 RepID=UPI0039C998D1